MSEEGEVVHQLEGEAEVRHEKRPKIPESMLAIEKFPTMGKNCFI